MRAEWILEWWIRDCKMVFHFIQRKQTLRGIMQLARVCVCVCMHMCVHVCARRGLPDSRRDLSTTRRASKVLGGGPMLKKGPGRDRVRRGVWEGGATGF